MRRHIFGAVLGVSGLLALGLGAGPAQATPLPFDSQYVLLTTIPVPPSPQNSVGGNFNTYDITFFDGTTQLDYVADRSNAAVDVFSAATNTFVNRVGGTIPGDGQLFTGQKPSNDVSGPDGVLVARFSLGGTPQNPQLWAGNGDSTLKGFDLTSANLFIPNSAAAQLSGTPINTGGTARVDEMAFDPRDHLLAVSNNADTPPFLTIVDASTHAIVKKVPFDGSGGAPNATNGLEQSVWDGGRGVFYVSVPEINCATPGSGCDPGGVSVISTAGVVTQTYHLADFGIASCAPAGLALGIGGKLMIGCSNGGTQTILLDPNANAGKGSIKTFPQVSGTDMVWFDPATHRFFVASRANVGGPVVGVIDADTEAWLENIPTTPGDHSVAVDPVSGEVFVPMGGVAGNSICATGCIGVFGVPEPGSLLLLGAGLAGLGGLGWRRRHRG